MSLDKVTTKCRSFTLIIFVLFIGLITSPLSQANITQHGQWLPKGSFSAIELGEGELSNYAYLLGEKGIEVWDTESLSKLGQNYQLKGKAREIIVSGNYLYVTEDNCLLEIFALNQPNGGDPVKVGQYCGPMEIQSTDIAVYQNYVYIWEDTNLEILESSGGSYYQRYYDSLHVIDVSDVKNPVSVDKMRINSRTLSIQVDRNYLLLGAKGDPSWGYANITSNAKTPNITYIAAGHIPVYKMWLYDNHMFMFSEFESSPHFVFMMDFLTPSASGGFENGGFSLSPESSTSLQDGGVSSEACWILLSDSKNGDAIIYLVELATLSPTNELGNEIYPLANPYNAAGSSEYYPEYYGEYASSLAVRDKPEMSGVSELFMVGKRFIRHLIVDFSEGKITPFTQSLFPIGIFSDSAVADGYIYVVNQEGLKILSSSDFSEIPMGELFTPGNAKAITVSGDYAYIADGYSGLQIVDISGAVLGSSGDELSIVGTYDTDGYARDVVVIGNYAYVADGALQIIDVSNPVNPIKVGEYTTVDGVRVQTGLYDYETNYTGFVAEVAIVDDNRIAVMASGKDIRSQNTTINPDGSVGGGSLGEAEAVGFHLLDISNPSSPVQVSSYDTDTDGDNWGASGIAVDFPYVYMLYGEDGLVILDITDTTPVRLSHYNTVGKAEAIAIEGNYAYIADGDAGLHVVDISDPTAPITAGTHDTDGYASNVSISENYVYVSDSKNGLIILSLWEEREEEIADYVRVFQWGENTFTDILPISGMTEMEIPPFNVRYYPVAGTYLGYHPTEQRFYIYNPTLFWPEITPLGLLSEYLPLALQAGF